MELKLRRNNQLVNREEREDKVLHNKTVLGRVGHDLHCICYDTTHAPFSENKDGELMQCERILRVWVFACFLVC